MNVVVNRFTQSAITQRNNFFSFDRPFSIQKMTSKFLMNEQGIITEAAFSGHGCAISQASADILLESVVGKTVDEVKKLTKDDLLDLLGIELGPVRLKCALLSLKVLKAGAYGMGEAGDEIIDKV